MKPCRPRWIAGLFKVTDQRWNRWGRERKGVKAFFTFLPFYFFTFKR